jgi:hypothetical protein
LKDVAIDGPIKDNERLSASMGPSLLAREDISEFN